MNLLLLILFTVFVIFTSIYIYNRNHVFGLVYILLFIYCFFTMVAYLYFPEELNIVSSGQYYGENYFIKFILYIFACFIFTFIFYFLISNIKINIFKINFVNYSRNKILKRLFSIIIISWLLILTYFLLKNYNLLSYHSQSVMKSNKIWFFLYAISPIFIISIYLKVSESIKIRKKIFYFILLILAFVLFLVTSLKSGQRIEIFCLTLSIITFIIVKYDIKINNKNISKLIKLLIILICFVFLSQVIRNNRHTNLNISQIDFDGSYFADLLNIKEFVFQDYVTPSLTLLTSMEYKIIKPIEIIKSVFFNTLIVFDYPGMGEIISKLLVPSGDVGVGYYYFTEGYNFIGILGCVFSPLFLVISYELYKKILCSTNDKKFNEYISAIISCYIISVVRGGSLFIFKGILFYIIPFIFLYICVTNKKLIFVRR